MWTTMHATAFVVIMFIIIGSCGWMTQRPVQKTWPRVTGTPNNRWLFGACLLWLIAMSLNIPIPAITFLVIGGPIAFTLGLIYPTIRKYWKTQ